MKRTNWKAWVVMALGPVMLLSCASTAHIEKDESVNFNNYKSFAWLHGEYDVQQDFKTRLEKKGFEDVEIPELHTEIGLG